MRRIVIELSDKEVEIGKGIHMTLVEQANPSEEELCRKVIQEVKRQCDMPEQHFISIEPEFKTIKDMEVLQELVDELKRQAESGKGVTVEVYEKDDRPDAYRYAYVAERLINKHKEDTAEPGKDDLVEDIKAKLWEFIKCEIKKYRDGELEGALLEMVPQATHELVELIKFTRQR